jgi:hypothetical protein
VINEIFHPVAARFGTKVRRNALWANHQNGRTGQLFSEFLTRALLPFSIDLDDYCGAPSCGRFSRSNHSGQTACIARWVRQHSPPVVGR